MATNANAFVDTNVLLRATVMNAPLHREAVNLILSHRSSGAELWISRQVIREYLINLTRPQPSLPLLSVTQAQTRVEILLRLFQVADETAQVTARLLQLMKDIPIGGKQVHDANIVATMLAYGIGTLLTQNVDDMQRFASKIRIIPLAQATP